MKDITIAYAGCDQAVLKKLQVSANLFAGEGYSLCFKQWEGVNADILVANPEDAFGYKSADVAHRHGVPTMLITTKKDQYRELLGDSSIVVDGDQPAGLFFRLVEKLLTKGKSAAQAVVDSSQQGAVLSNDGLLPELSELFNAETPVRFGTLDNFVYLIPKKGVCAASSKADFVAVRDAIRSHTPLEFSPVESSQSLAELTHYVSSEGFFFHSLVGMQDLKNFPQHKVSLSSWPNIKSKKFAAELASLSASLVVSSCNASALITGCGSPRVANAMLYAAHISGLLEVSEVNESELSMPEAPAALVSNQGAAKKSHGIVGALSKWLGMH